MFPGHYKMDGHTDVKHKKAFKDAKSYREKKVRTKGGRQSKGDTDYSYGLGKAILDKILPVFYILVFLGLVAVVGIYVKARILPKQLDHIERGEALTKERLLQEEKETINFLLKSGQSLVDKKKYQKALEEYKRILLVDPDNKKAQKAIRDLELKIK